MLPGAGADGSGNTTFQGLFQEIQLLQQRLGRVDSRVRPACCEGVIAEQAIHPHLHFRQLGLTFVQAILCLLQVRGQQLLTHLGALAEGDQGTLQAVLIHRSSGQGGLAFGIMALQVRHELLAVPDIVGDPMAGERIAAHYQSLGLRISRGQRRTPRSVWGRAEALASEVAQRREFLLGLPQAARLEWDSSMQRLAAQGALCCWERIVYASLRPDVLATPDFERWQTATKLIRSPELSSIQVLAAAIEFARQGRLVAAIYALTRFLQESRPRRQEAIRATCLVLAAVNDDRLRGRAAKAGKACRSYMAFQEECVHVLLDLLQSAAVAYGPLTERLQRLQNLLGQEGAHGHALALRWMERQLPTLPQDGWVVEVGCSREIIEGQHSTAQLAGFAREQRLRFAGIDLDPENIRALQRELGEQGRRFLLGKGEELLSHWDEPIAALYLDAYDFWHRSHSEIRESVYREAYGTGINDRECQLMHLIAVREGSRSLVAGGVLAIDDTWRDAGMWQGKGALAVPWLLEQGWPLLEAADRAVVFLKPGNAAHDPQELQPEG